MWLPLNGNLRNQGLSDVIVTNNGATIDNNGKIGKCYSFDGSDDYISLTTTALNNIFKGGEQPFSIALWIFHGDATRAIIFGDYGLSGTIGFNIELSVSHGVRFYWNGTPDKYFSPTIPVSQWTHVCLTYDGANILFYINGGLKTDKYSGTLSSKNKTSGSFYLGRDSRTGTTALNGKLNDVRIYDHALSPREVKEISKGLVLHYTLSGSGTNLLPCTYTKSSPRTTTLKSTDGNAWVPNSAFEAKPSTTYTISVECDGNLSNAHGSGGMSPSEKPWSFWLYICNTNTTKDWAHGAYDTPVNLTRVNNNYRKIGNTHVWTYTLSSTQKYISLRTNSYSNGTDNVTINWWNMKVEEGSIFTPWIPNASDPLYTQMGLNNNIEYDVSGFCNNGTKTGTLTYSADTPKYWTSTTFDGNTYIRCNRPFAIPCSQFTACGWVNLIQGYATNNGCHLFTLGDTYCRVCISKDGAAFRVLFTNNGTNFTMNSVKTAGQLSADVWNFYAITFDNNIVKIYINGVLDNSATANISAITSANDYIQIGAHATEYPKAKVSDFRFYSTALSADDILELYNTPISLTSNGVLMTSGELTGA